MGVRDWLGGASQVVVEIDGNRFEAKGEPDMVWRAFEAFLDKLRPASDSRGPAQPQVMEDESTAVDPAPSTRRKKFLRVHAIDGNIAKVYPLDQRRLRAGQLSRVVDLEKVGNIYVESRRLSDQLRGEQNTVWHMIVPQVASGSSRTS